MDECKGAFALGRRQRAGPGQNIDAGVPGDVAVRTVFEFVLERRESGAEHRKIQVGAGERTVEVERHAVQWAGRTVQADEVRHCFGLFLELGW